MKGDTTVSSVPTITLQILDIIGCMDDTNTEDLDKMKKRDVDDDDGENAEAEEIKNLYDQKIQYMLSKKNDQIIKISGRTSDDKSIMVNVRGFSPFLYVGLPEGIDGTPVGDETKMQIDLIVGLIRSKVHYTYKGHLLKWEKHYMQPFEQFIGNDHYLYLKLYFRNQPALREYEKVLQSETHFIASQFRNPVAYFIGESNVDEVLKFIHQRDIQPTSWIEISNYSKRSEEMKSSIMQVEVDISLNNVVKVDRVTNSPFKIMIYDLECASKMGELGEFAVSVKNYQKLAKEFIDLWVSYKTHPLVKDDISFSRTVDTCLRLVFTDYFYPQQLTQVATVNSLKPTPTAIKDVSRVLAEYYCGCASTVSASTVSASTVSASTVSADGDLGASSSVNMSHQEGVFPCTDCLDHVTSVMLTSFPDVEDPNSYMQLCRQVLWGLKRLDGFKYFYGQKRYETIVNYTTTMLNVAFEEYFDSFVFSPISLKDGVCKPTVTQLMRLTPSIIRIIKSTLKYDLKQKELAEFLSEKLLVSPRGDPIIQIGFTLIRLGEPQPYVKGVLTLDTCQEFTNSDLMFDENNSEMTSQEIHSFCAQHNLSPPTQTTVANFLAAKQAETDRSRVFIKCYERETDMIKAFAKLIKMENPDMIGGYNTFGFDDKYLDNRARELGISEYFLSNISRLKRDLALIKQPAGSDQSRKQTSKSGVGRADEPVEKDERKGKKRMETDYLEMKGRISFDIYRIVSTTYDFLPEFKLDAVCKYFLKKQKNDVPPHMISVLQRGTPKDRSIVARYCIIDCILCNRLLSKLLVVNNLIAMSNVALVPIRYLLFRGQTIKGLSLVVKKCTSRNKVVRTLRLCERSKDSDKYEGAIVLDPIIDIHHDPVSVGDFNSLYPSSMISENISNDTKVCDSKYDNLPGFHYNTISYNQFEYQAAFHKITKVELKRKEKVKKADKMVCRFVGNAKGILPEIEEELIAARKEAKKKNKEYLKAGNQELADVWDCCQNALKITCNSIYGITGAPVSPVYNRDVAACITATGQKMIMFSKGYVEDNYRNILFPISEAKVSQREVLVNKATCIYGDSVTGDTPVFLRHLETKTIIIKTFNEIDQWNTNSCNLAALDSNSDLNFKMYSTSWNDYQIWSHCGWTKIHNVMKHKTQKKIFRVSTTMGLVDVTEDHSLVLNNLTPIKPNDCVVGETKLLHCQFEMDSTFARSEMDHGLLGFPVSLDEKKATIYGCFFDCGFCTSDNKLSWHFSSQNLDGLNELLGCLLEVYDIRPFRTFKQGRGYTVECASFPQTLINEYRSQFYDNSNNKKVPEIILNSSVNVKKWFVNGYCIAKGYERMHHGLILSCKGKIGSSGLCYLCRQLGYNIRIESDGDFFKIVCARTKGGDVIESMQELPRACVGDGDGDGVGAIDVYDITTENHMFGVGPGSMIVHNTDSIFIKFDITDPTTNRPIEGRDAIFISMEICSRVTREISCQLKYPQNLEFEKTIFPFLITSKKMYKGNYYKEMNSEEYEEKTMGFTTKKRDSAPIAKVVVNGLTDLLFRDRYVNTDMIKDYIREQFRKIVNGEYAINYFIRTKKWQGHYANPEQIAHHVLAMRQAARDPGNQFQMNDRVPFVHIVNPKAVLQGDRIETIDFIKKNGLQVDYQHYVGKLLIKPLVKILSPNKRLGISEKWLLDLLKMVYNHQSHTKTIGDIFKIIPAGHKAADTKTVGSLVSSSESESD